MIKTTMDAIVSYYTDSPIQYELLIKEINVDLEKDDTPRVFHDIFLQGEKINSELALFLQSGIRQAVLYLFFGQVYRELFKWRLKKRNT